MKRIQVLLFNLGAFMEILGPLLYLDSPESVAKNPETMPLTCDLILTLHVTFLRKL